MTQVRRFLLFLRTGSRIYGKRQVTRLIKRTAKPPLRMSHTKLPSGGAYVFTCAIGKGKRATNDAPATLKGLSTGSADYLRNR